MVHYTCKKFQKHKKCNNTRARKKIRYSTTVICALFTTSISWSTLSNFSPYCCSKGKSAKFLLCAKNNPLHKGKLDAKRADKFVCATDSNASSSICFKLIKHLKQLTLSKNGECPQPFSSSIRRLSNLSQGQPS